MLTIFYGICMQFWQNLHEITLFKIFSNNIINFPLQAHINWFWHWFSTLFFQLAILDQSLTPCYRFTLLNQNNGNTSKSPPSLNIAVWESAEKHQEFYFRKSSSLKFVIHWSLFLFEVWVFRGVIRLLTIFYEISMKFWQNLYRNCTF